MFIYYMTNRQSRYSSSEIVIVYMFLQYVYTTYQYVYGVCVACVRCVWLTTLFSVPGCSRCTPSALRSVHLESRHAGRAILHLHWWEKRLPLRLTLVCLRWQRRPTPRRGYAPPNVDMPIVDAESDPVRRRRPRQREGREKRLPSQLSVLVIVLLRLV